MNILSLCTGYGGLDLAVEQVLGGTTRWVSDIDRDACAVQAVRFPHAAQLGDLKEIDWQALAGQVDIITAGYPCQPFSQAGRRQGAEDERHLWPWIADGIRVLRPKLVVLENVRGHLRRGFDAVLADLADMGMSARWGTVLAAEAGAPHRRERIFVAAYPDGHGPCGVTPGDGPDRRLEVEPGHDADLRSVAAPAHPDAPGRERVEGRSEPGRIAQLATCAAGTDWRQFGPAIARWERRMGRAAPPPLVDGTRQLNARLVEWMMGLPDGWVTDVLPNRRALKVLGNGVVPQQAALALRMLLEEP